MALLVIFDVDIMIVSLYLHGGCSIHVECICTKIRCQPCKFLVYIMYNFFKQEVLMQNLLYNSVLMLLFQLLFYYFFALF